MRISLLRESAALLLMVAPQVELMEVTTKRVEKIMMTRADLVPSPRSEIKSRVSIPFIVASSESLILSIRMDD